MGWMLGDILGSVMAEAEILLVSGRLLMPIC